LLGSKDLLTLAILPDKKYLERINSGTGGDKVIKNEVINAIKERSEKTFMEIAVGLHDKANRKM
jgi:hypothetical protein